jgi:hypothetical protein
LVKREIEASCKEARAALDELLDYHPKILNVTDKAETLADIYIDKRIVTEAHRHDALHAALATLDEVDVYVSWNYRNILHLFQVRRFVTANLELGLKPIQIRSPRVVASHEVAGHEFLQMVASD